MNPYRTTDEQNTRQEVIPPTDKTLAIDDPLPDNPIGSGLSVSGLSLSGVVNRARTRAELSREALAIYRHAATECMRQQAEVILQARELKASNLKRSQFEAFLGANAELVDRLWNRLEDAVNNMKDAELLAIIKAEEQAMSRKQEIEEKVGAGVIDSEAGARLLAVIDEHRLFKARAALDRCGEFLGELRGQMMMTIRSLEVDTKRFI